MPSAFASRAARAGGVVTLALCLACTNDATAPGSSIPVVQMRHLDTVLSVSGWHPFHVAASVDGWVFAGGYGGLYRAARSDLRHWTLLAPVNSPGADIFALYAPSRDTVFATFNGLGVAIWDSAGGFRSMTMPAAPSGCGFGTNLWGRGTQDVYASGDCAMVAHFDGAQWSLQTVPDTAAAVPFYGLGGTGSTTFAGGNLTLLRQSDLVAWTPVDLTGLPSDCWVTAVAADAHTGYFTSGNCLAAVDSTGHVVVIDSLLPYALFAGKPQVDGSALFWGYSGAILRVRNRVPTAFNVDGAGPVGAAVMFGDSLVLPAFSYPNGQLVVALP